MSPLKIFIHSMDGTGHQNACIGLGQALAKRGHRVIYLLNAEFSGQMVQFGMKEILLNEIPRPKISPTVDPMKAAAAHLISSGLLSPMNSLDKMKCMGKAGFMSEIYNKTCQFNNQIEWAIESEHPDLIILDHFLIPPAVLQSKVLYLLVFSGNPLMLYNSDQLPPSCSGFPTTSDASSWSEFKSAFNESFLDLIRNYQKSLNDQFGYKLPDVVSKDNFHLSPYLNIYGYPQELDYQDIVPLTDKFAQVDAFCREVVEPFEIEFPLNSGQKLIYFSMGSIGCIDVELMKRIVSVLGKSPHKFIISKGPRADEYELPDNCWGRAHLPQTRILPLVDLVITHGGNNTVTETFQFGKPMIVMPLFADQYDNAQRIQEKGFGIRLNPFDFQDQELIDSIDRLLNDESLYERLQIAVTRIETSNSKERACARIESIVPYTS